MKYFTIEELCASATAKARGIDNTPSAEVEDSLRALTVNLLEPVRELYGGPIIVNSGYRSPELNKAVKGTAGSQHLKGEAADITTGKIGANKVLFDMIVASDLPYDQIIDESGYSWIHISYSPRHRRQILHL